MKYTITIALVAQVLWLICHGVSSGHIRKDPSTGTSPKASSPSPSKFSSSSLHPLPEAVSAAARDRLAKRFEERLVHFKNKKGLHDVDKKKLKDDLVNTYSTFLIEEAAQNPLRHPPSKRCVQIQNTMAGFNCDISET
jgi:hypothetical protein